MITIDFLCLTRQGIIVYFHKDYSGIFLGGRVWVELKQGVAMYSPVWAWTPSPSAPVSQMPGLQICSIMPGYTKTILYVNYFILAVPKSVYKILYLLGKSFTTWATSQPFSLFLSYFSDGVLIFPVLALDHDLPTYGLRWLEWQAHATMLGLLVEEGFH
jgi:hypothetical protein